MDIPVFILDNGKIINHMGRGHLYTKLMVRCMRVSLKMANDKENVLRPILLVKDTMDLLIMGI